MTNLSTSEPIDAAPLVVELETAPSSGRFAADERLRVEELTLGSDEGLSSARVVVRVDDAFDAAAARSRYLPDRRVLVRTNEADPAARALLFEGYPPLLEAQWDGRPGHAADTCTFTAEHVYGRLARAPRCWIYGRYMRNGAIADGLAADPTAWEGATVLVGALPCIFNFDGRPNRAADPITVPGPDGTPRTVHVFTDDYDPQAKPWTLLNALRYLCWFHRPPEEPVGEGNVFSETDLYVSWESSAAMQAPSELVARLLAAPDSLTVEAANLVEALGRLAAAAGIHVTTETSNVEGRPQSALRVWSAGDGAPQGLPLARGGRYPDGAPWFDAAGMAPGEVRSANVLERATVAWDHRQVVNAPIVVGGVKQYEMTLPLVPGWVPEANLDSVAAPERPVAKDLAMTPDEIEFYAGDPQDVTWYRRYHKKGLDFDLYRDVARLWVLNEDGRFSGDIYDRNAPFDDYGPFDFSTVAPGVTAVGAWARRARRLRDTLTMTEGGEGFGVFVEVSFDSGATWSEPAGAVQVRFDPTGIYFGVVNPTSITPPDTVPEEQNLWFALIDQTLRVRVTALVEGDERLVVRQPPTDSDTPALWTTSRLLYRPSDYRFAVRSGTVNVLADINPTGTDLERDDTSAALRQAERIAQQEQDGRVEVVPRIPWLELGLKIGDTLSGIRGRGPSFASRLRRQTGTLVVVGKRFRLRGGHYETELVLARPMRPENGGES